MKIIIILALAALVLLSGCLDFHFEEDSFCRESFGEGWSAEIFVDNPDSFYCVKDGLAQWFPFFKLGGEWVYYNRTCHDTQVLNFNLQEYESYDNIDDHEKLCSGYQEEEVPEEPVGEEIETGSLEPCIEYEAINGKTLTLCGATLDVQKQFLEGLEIDECEWVFERGGYPFDFFVGEDEECKKYFDEEDYVTMQKLVYCKSGDVSWGAECGNLKKALEEIDLNGWTNPWSD